MVFFFLKYSFRPSVSICDRVQGALRHLVMKSFPSLPLFICRYVFVGMDVRHSLSKLQVLEQRLSSVLVKPKCLLYKLKRFGLNLGLATPNDRFINLVCQRRAAEFGLHEATVHSAQNAARQLL